MSDFCYSRPMLERIVRHAELMDSIMERLGIDPAVAARLDRGMAWYEARTRCLACCEERQCRHWLEQTDPAPMAAPRSCANVEFFRRCRVSRSNRDGGIAASARIDGDAS